MDEQIPLNYTTLSKGPTMTPAMIMSIQSDLNSVELNTSVTNAALVNHGPRDYSRPSSVQQTFEPLQQPDAPNFIESWRNLAMAPLASSQLVRWAGNRIRNNRLTDLVRPNQVVTQPAKTPIIIVKNYWPSIGTNSDQLNSSAPNGRKQARPEDESKPSVSLEEIFSRLSVKNGTSAVKSSQYSGPKMSNYANPFEQSIIDTTSSDSVNKIVIPGGDTSNRFTLMTDTSSHPTEKHWW